MRRNSLLIWNNVSAIDRRKLMVLSVLAAVFGASAFALQPVAAKTNVSVVPTATPSPRKIKRIIAADFNSDGPESLNRSTGQPPVPTATPRPVRNMDDISNGNYRRSGSPNARSTPATPATPRPFIGGSDDGSSMIHNPRNTRTSRPTSTARRASKSKSTTPTQPTKKPVKKRRP
ncbi:MAG: hypothetical protein ABL959_09110 [Pyrinomonadaceae bacterium]